jgi:hypothetical protein
MPHAQGRTGLERQAHSLSGGELEDRARAAAACDSPGPEVRRHSDDDELSVEEDSIDRTAHEPRVNRSRRTEKKAASLVERPAAEQAPETGERRIGHEAPLAGRAAVNVLERDLH